MKGLRYINPDDPFLEDVVGSLNSIELLALGYFEKWVDGNVLMRVYGDLVIDIINQIYIIKDGVGKHMLLQVPTAVSFYIACCNYCSELPVFGTDILNVD